MKSFGAKRDALNIYMTSPDGYVSITALHGICIVQSHQRIKCERANQSMKCSCDGEKKKYGEEIFLTERGCTDITGMNSQL